MVATTQTEMKKLLAQQYTVAVTKSLVSLTLACGLTIGIPLAFRSVKNPVDKVVNSLGFVGSCLLSVYAYINSYSIKEYGGKYKMFSDLEKERFIQEQVVSQQRYLEQVNQYYIPQIIEPEYCSDIPTAQHHHPTLQNATSIDTQDSHAPLQGEHCTTTLQNTTALICPDCDSQDIKSNGSSRGKKRYICNNCNKTFGEE